jgi:hypothetical protein
MWNQHQVRATEEEKVTLDKNLERRRTLQRTALSFYA